MTQGGKACETVPNEVGAAGSDPVKASPSPASPPRWDKNPGSILIFHAKNQRQPYLTTRSASEFSVGAAQRARPLDTVCNKFSRM